MSLSSNDNDSDDYERTETRVIIRGDSTDSNEHSDNRENQSNNRVELRHIEIKNNRNRNDSTNGPSDIEENYPNQINSGKNRSNKGQPGGAEDNEGWWSVIETLKRIGGASGTGNMWGETERVFSGSFGGVNNKREVWDLSDSVAELYQHEHRAESEAAAAVAAGVGLGGAGWGVGSSEAVRLRRRTAGLPADPFEVDSTSSKTWLAAAPTNGLVRIFAPSMRDPVLAQSQLRAVTLSTTARELCMLLGVAPNALHVQLNGDIVRRVEPQECPLVIQNDYLAALGYMNIESMQREACALELSYLVRFFSGKPMHDSTFTRRQLQVFIDIKKSGLLQTWTRRVCVLSGTRLLIYKDMQKKDEPSTMQLACGSVEEIKFKGHDHCLKLTSTLHGEKVIYLSFTVLKDYNRWLRRCKKATDKLPTTADLSSCHLEYLPEILFINNQLGVLNLQHNVLRERPQPIDDEPEPDSIGWIDDLSRFNQLRSLNLADNSLAEFPVSICNIQTLMELNLASNKLYEIPSEIRNLVNLQALHLHNNHLTSLPDDLIGLRKLFILVLAFNRFVSLPPVVARITNVRCSEVENIIMAGNQIERISSEALMEMKYVKKIDLRMNRLKLATTDTMKFSVLERLTHLDIRDNHVTELDLRVIKTLEYLSCERNGMTSLLLNGTSLKNLFAGCNCLDHIAISPKPEWLLQLDISDNCLVSLPDWLSECFFLQKISADQNFLQDLPARLLVDAKRLKCLKLGHNRLTQLPVDIDSLPLEELQIQHNQITHLPTDFLIKANRLRILNATKNRLSQLPKLNENPDLNRIHELYLSGNCLGNTVMATISSYPRLKILHIAENEISELYENDIKKLEMVQELNVSCNKLEDLPDALGQLPRLVVLRAHSNYLTRLPDFHKATSLKVLDVGHNQLLNVSLTSLMASQLHLLDMALNTQLRVDPKEFKHVKNKKSVCLVDLTGQNRLIPGLTRRSAPTAPVQTGSEISNDLDTSIPWRVGFSESLGIRNKLCITMLRLLTYDSDDESLFGMFDGGRNVDVPKKLAEIFPSLLRDEINRNPNSPSHYMKYTLLTAHRNLGSTGQKLGASAVLCHIRRKRSGSHTSSRRGHAAPSGGYQLNEFTLDIANAGDVEAVLCRQGEALLLTRKFVTTYDIEECQRVHKSDGIITEDGKVNGITRCTRQLGCAFLYPKLIPDPFVASIPLRNDDEFIIIGTSGFWEYVGYEEAVEEIYEIGQPVVASKHLLDLAQGYGSRENVAVMVIRLNTDLGPSLARLRPPNRDMSVDDIEAAREHEAARQKRLAAAASAAKTAGPVERRNSKITISRVPASPVVSEAYTSSAGELISEEEDLGSGEGGLGQTGEGKVGQTRERGGEEEFVGDGFVFRGEQKNVVTSEEDFGTGQDTEEVFVDEPNHFIATTINVDKVIHSNGKRSLSGGNTRNMGSGKVESAGKLEDGSKSSGTQISGTSGGPRQPRFIKKSDTDTSLFANTIPLHPEESPEIINSNVKSVVPNVVISRPSPNKPLVKTDVKNYVVDESSRSDRINQGARQQNQAYQTNTPAYTGHVKANENIGQSTGHIKPNETTRSENTKHDIAAENTNTQRGTYRTQTSSDTSKHTSGSTLTTPEGVELRLRETSASGRVNARSISRANRNSLADTIALFENKGTDSNSAGGASPSVPPKNSANRVRVRSGAGLPMSLAPEMKPSPSVSSVESGGSTSSYTLEHPEAAPAKPRGRSPQPRPPVPKRTGASLPSSGQPSASERLGGDGKTLSPPIPEVSRARVSPQPPLSKDRSPARSPVRQPTVVVYNKNQNVLSRQSSYGNQLESNSARSMQNTGNNQFSGSVSVNQLDSNSTRSNTGNNQLSGLRPNSQSGLVAPGYNLSRNNSARSSNSSGSVSGQGRFNGEVAGGSCGSVGSGRGGAAAAPSEENSDEIQLGEYGSAKVIEIARL